ncbi:hypothetical protein PTI98_011733 [Pleurotus ostreatus]|nr:hypothetical protein PTI98_011733 [Pleurotus ostreatus]
MKVVEFRLLPYCVGEKPSRVEGRIVVKQQCLSFTQDCGNDHFVESTRSQLTDTEGFVPICIVARGKEFWEVGFDA